MVRKTFLRCILILILGLFSHNTCKAYFLRACIAKYVTSKTIQYVVPIVALLTYVAYKKVKKAFFSKDEEKEKLKKDMIDITFSIDDLKKDTDANFQETKINIQDSKKSLVEKIEFVREQLEFFTNKRVGECEEKLQSAILITKTDLLKKLESLHQDINKCATKDQVVTLDESIKNLYDTIGQMFNETYDKIEETKIEMRNRFDQTNENIEKVKAEVSIASKGIIDFRQEILHNFENHENKNEERHKKLYEKGESIESQFGTMNAEVNKIGREVSIIGAEVSAIKNVMIEKGYNTGIEKPLLHNQVMYSRNRE